jgi:hypothetical protein
LQCAQAPACTHDCSVQRHLRRFPKLQCAQAPACITHLQCAQAPADCPAGSQPGAVCKGTCMSSGLRCAQAPARIYDCSVQRHLHIFPHLQCAKAPASRPAGSQLGAVRTGACTFLVAVCTGTCMNDPFAVCTGTCKSPGWKSAGCGAHRPLHESPSRSVQRHLHETPPAVCKGICTSSCCSVPETPARLLVALCKVVIAVCNRMHSKSGCGTRGDGPVGLMEWWARARAH